MFKEITDISELELEVERKYPIPEQHGVVRLTEYEQRCASRGCGSPTHYRLRTTPYCHTHLIRKLNEMLLEAGIDFEP